MFVKPDSTDDPEFIILVNSLTERELTERKPQELYVVRIANWFGEKWLKFSGLGVVDFQFPAFMGRFDAALEEFRQEKVTFPPFSPNKVLRQLYFRNDGTGSYLETSPTWLPHREQRHRSNENLHRRIRNFSDSAVFVWFSSNTVPNRRGSLMVYMTDGDTTWFASFKKDSVWTPVVVKGIDRKEILKATQ